MRKIFYSMLLLLLAVIHVEAKQITQEQALNIAQNTLSSASGLRNNGENFNLIQTVYDSLQVLRSSETVLYYVYNQSEGGYIIISGDDLVYPIIGYSPTGKYDPDNLPPNFQLWMEDVAYGISKAINENLSSSEKNQSAWESYLKGNVNLRSSQNSYLVQTTWGQDAPYNHNCPTGSVTGCVATTMAQIMNYHRCPDGSMSGTIPAYTTKTKGYPISSINLNGISYNWTTLANPTSTNFETEVAKLMYHCGASVKMDYDVSSGAFADDAVIALYTYFGYDKGIQMKYKGYYPHLTWKNMLISEIAADRPVFYSGTNSSNGGHAFVCDGYNNSTEMFHFNWGWNGYSDDYFYIDDIDYKYNNVILTGIQPNQGGILPYEIVIGPDVENFYFPDINTETSQINPGELFNVKGSFWNIGTGTFYGNLGFVLLNKDYSFVSVIGYGSLSDAGLQKNQLTKEISISCSVPNTIPDGNYLIKAAIQEKGSSTWQVINAYEGYVSELPLQVGKGETPTIEVTGVSLNETSKTLWVGDKLQLTATVSPGNASNQDVNWNSSNDKVVSVDDNGLVTANAKGNAIITVTTVDGGKTATCAITVNVAVNGVSLNISDQELKKGETLQLTAMVQPTDATNQNVTWSSSDDKVVSVDDNGLVTANAKGNATITVTTVEGRKEASCLITVTEDVGINAPALISVYMQSDLIYIESNEAETIQFFSITGNIIMQKNKPVGVISYSADSISKEVFIVKGSSGWVRKILIK